MKRFLCHLATIVLILGLVSCSHVNSNVSDNLDRFSEEQAFSKESDKTASIGISDQQHIDDALVLYQSSQELRSEDRIDEAIAALDQTYEAMLRIPSSEDPEIVQQKEDLRQLISKRIIEIYTSRLQNVHTGGNGAIPLVLNKYVEREIKSFQTNERSFFIDSYRRSGKYRGYIEEKLEEAGLPPEIVWLPLIESGYKVRAFSRARALGPWQFIASTGYRYNLKRDQWIDERMDYQKSTQAAIGFLTTLHDLFGDWTTALAGYNCGEGNVRRAIRQQKVNYLDNFWDLYPMLPSETARYVPRFMAVLHIVNDPERYGFTELTYDAPIEYDEVCVTRQMQLKDIAKTLSINTRELEELNPSLRHKVTPNYTFTLRVPPTKGEILTAKLDEVPACQVNIQSYARHRVRNGETLSQIARKYRTSVRKIARLNNIRNVSKIRVGQRIKVPLRHALTTFSSTKSTPSADTLSDDLVRYRVRQGDTLWAIAQKYNTSVKKIKRINGLASSFLKTGQVLRVPAGS